MYFVLEWEGGRSCAGGRGSVDDQNRRKAFCLCIPPLCLPVPLCVCGRLASRDETTAATAPSAEIATATSTGGSQGTRTWSSCVDTAAGGGSTTARERYFVCVVCGACMRTRGCLILYIMCLRCRRKTFSCSINTCTRNCLEVRKCKYLHRRENGSVVVLIVSHQRCYVLRRSAENENGIVVCTRSCSFLYCSLVSKTAASRNTPPRPLHLRLLRRLAQQWRCSPFWFMLRGVLQRVLSCSMCCLPSVSNLLH